MTLSAQIDYQKEEYVRASNLAALEDENKTLREALEKARHCILDTTGDVLNKHHDILGTIAAALSQNVNKERSDMSKPAALPVEGKGEPIDQSLRDAAKAMGAVEAKNPTLVGAAAPSSQAQEDGR